MHSLADIYGSYCTRPKKTGMPINYDHLYSRIFSILHLVFIPHLENKESNAKMWGENIHQNTSLMYHSKNNTFSAFFNSKVKSRYNDSIGPSKKCRYMWTVTISRPILEVKWQIGTSERCRYIQTVAISGVIISRLYCTTIMYHYFLRLINWMQIKKIRVQSFCYIVKKWENRLCRL